PTLILSKKSCSNNTILRTIRFARERERSRTPQLRASCQCHGQKYFSLVPAGGTLDTDGMISSPTASERYPGRIRERFLSLVPAVRIVRMHVLPSTADSEHASDTESSQKNYFPQSNHRSGYWILVAGLGLLEAEQPMNCALRARAVGYVAAASLSHSAAYVAQERTAHLPLPCGVQWGILGIGVVVGLADVFVDVRELLATDTPVLAHLK
ncbi:hypothetical protein PV326_009053, partial [Microctonus aethiopoides]